MRHSSLLSYRFALFTTLGLLHACGGRSGDAAAERKSPPGEDSGTGSDRGSGHDAGESGTGGSGARPGGSSSGGVMSATGAGGAGSATGGSELEVGGSAGGPEPGSVPVASATSPPLPPEPGDAGVDGSVDTAECVGDPNGDAIQACGSGVLHRVRPATCASELPRDFDAWEENPVPLPQDGGVDAGSDGRPELPFSYYSDDPYSYYNFSCYEDTDCVTRANGFCQADNWDIDTSYSCSYGCTTDSECDEGEVCECGSPVGQCVPALCTTDADCDEGSLCARFSYNDGCGTTTGYACTASQDECMTAEDCGDDQCQYDRAVGYRTCFEQNCVIGRPFLVEGIERLARVVPGADWLSGGALGKPIKMKALEREQVLHYWQQVGLMEHASVAAFARFALQLMSLGAPSALLEGAQQAMADETRHAKLAFELASRFAQRELGPGPLEVTGALELSGVRDIVLTTVLEGCIGETVAALEASSALERASDEQVMQTLSEIERDERRHAELAWRFVQWALERHPELRAEVLALVQSEQQRAQARVRSLEPSRRQKSLERYGVVTDAQRARLRARVLDTVVLPCVQALCQDSSEVTSGKRSRIVKKRSVKAA